MLFIQGANPQIQGFTRTTPTRRVRLPTRRVGHLRCLRTRLYSTSGSSDSSSPREKHKMLELNAYQELGATYMLIGSDKQSSVCFPLHFLVLVWLWSQSRCSQPTIYPILVEYIFSIHQVIIWITRYGSGHSIQIQYIVFLVQKHTFQIEHVVE